jgi:hypothetical protein
VTAAAFLDRYARTVGVLVPATAALVAAWLLAGPRGWGAAVAVAAGWSVVVAWWLRRQRWGGGAVLLSCWAAPAAVLTLPVRLGWSTADGFVLWWSLATLLSVALVSAAGR